MSPSETKIEFTLPRPVVKEGDYSVRLAGKLSSIRVARIKLLT
jgi:hypothetical protein